MKIRLLLAFGIYCLSLKAQKVDHRIFINPSLGFFRVTNDKSELNNKPLMFELKAGIYLSKLNAFGVQYSRASQNDPRTGPSSLQPSGGGNWTQVGTLRHKLTAYGVFYDHFFFASKNLVFFPSAYGQYIHYTDEESGYIIAGNDSSTLYRRGSIHNWFGRIGINLNAQYNVTSTISITAKFAQVDCRLWNNYEQHFFLELPLVLGVKYLFK